MSFCLNCSSHRPCQCAGPPPEVTDSIRGTPIVSHSSFDNRHPSTKWFDQQVEEGLIPRGHMSISESQLNVFMTKAFNAGASYACREISDVLPRGPLNDCCKDELQFAVEDIDAICAEWLG